MHMCKTEACEAVPASVLAIIEASAASITSPLT